MNRLFTILCMASLLVFHTSCNDYDMDLESPSVEMKTRAVDQRVQNLIQQARNGDAEAYMSLATCYREGDGVEKSLLNTIYMYAYYCNKTGEKFKNIVESFEEGDPLRLLIEILDSFPKKEYVNAKIEQMKLRLPAEGKTLEIARNAVLSNDLADAMSLFREMAKEGSELAIMMEIFYSKEYEDVATYEQHLTKHVGKYPFLNLLLGEIYANKYHQSKNSADIQMAIDYYYKADAYAMLMPRYADELLRIYEHFGTKGLLKANEEEIKRLKKISKKQ